MITYCVVFVVNLFSARPTTSRTRQALQSH